LIGLEIEIEDYPACCNIICF